MQYSTLLLSLASLAAAGPVEKRAISGNNPGSIFLWDPAPVARNIFYTVGSCGLSTYFVGVVPDSMPLVAMPSSVMSNYGFAQHNTLCGKIVTMTNSRGITQQAAIADTNVGGDNSIDMTVDLWTGFGQPVGDGSIIPSLSWSISDGGSPNPACNSSYTVVSGDSCWAIWTRFGITEAQLRAWNPSLNSACDIQPGQVLCVSK